MKKIFLNGFGRIGRVLFRLMAKDDFFKEVDIIINDPYITIENMAYLLKYDSIYGRFENYEVSFAENDLLLKKEGFTKTCTVLHVENLCACDMIYDECLLIDCSNQKMKRHFYRLLLDRFTKILVTHWLDNAPYYVPGINDDINVLLKNKVISTGICDVVGIGTIIQKFLRYEIQEISIVTLHPWLSYQNVLDGQPRDVLHNNSPFYQIGRESINSIIPKESSLNAIMNEIYKNKCQKINVMTYRVPTDAVTCCDLSIKLMNHSMTKEAVVDLLYDDNIEICYDPMVSRDFVNCRFFSSVDVNWIKIQNNTIHLTIWYNNELGYCNSVFKTVKCAMED